MRAVNLFLSLLIVISGIQLFAQEHKPSPKYNKENHGQWKHPKPNKETKELLKTEREAFDANLSETEKATIEKARGELKVLKTKMKGKKEEMSKEDWMAFKKKKMTITAPVAEIAKNHEAELEVVLKKLHEQKMASCEKKESEKEYIKEKPNDKKDPSKKGTDKKECEKKEGCHKGGSKGKSEHCHGGDKAIMKEKFGTMFLLRGGAFDEKNEEAPQISVFPNPTISSNTIKFNHPADGKIIIYLIDKEGKEIKEIMNEFRIAGSQEVTFDASDLSKGDIFFYRINDNGNVSSKKFIMAD